MNCAGICVGVIAKPVGVRGQVKIRTYTESPESFLRFSSFCLEDGTEVALKSPKITDKDEITAFVAGYADRTEVEKLRLKEIFVKRKDLKELGEGEYYFEDLVGLDVFNQKFEKVRKVNATLDYGAGTFLDIEYNSAGRIATLPFNKNSIIDIDLEKNVLKVDDSYLLI